MVEYIPAAIAAAQAIMGRNSANKNADMVSNLQYQPIDLKSLQEQARRTAEENARKSLELERSLTPDVASARSGSAKMVADDLKDGGQLPLDVANQVTTASMGQSNAAGLYGGAGPITAAQLGLSSLALRDQRLNRALQLSQANPLPVSGLDPGSEADLAVAQNNATNQFALNKAGLITKTNQSKADSNGALLGAAGSLASEYFKRKG